MDLVLQLVIQLHTWSIAICCSLLGNIYQCSVKLLYDWNTKDPLYWTDISKHNVNQIYWLIMPSLCMHMQGCGRGSVGGAIVSHSSCTIFHACMQCMQTKFSMAEDREFLRDFTFTVNLSKNCNATHCIKCLNNMKQLSNLKHTFILLFWEHCMWAHWLPLLLVWIMCTNEVTIKIIP